MPVLKISGKNLRILYNTGSVNERRKETTGLNGLG